LPLDTDFFADFAVGECADFRLFDGLARMGGQSPAGKWRRKMKKFFVLLAVLALFMLSFGSCETLSDESAYNIGYTAGYLGAEISS